MPRTQFWSLDSITVAIVSSFDACKTWLWIRFRPTCIYVCLYMSIAFLLDKFIGTMKHRIWNVVQIRKYANIQINWVITHSSFGDGIYYCISFNTYTCIYIHNSYYKPYDWFVIGQTWTHIWLYSLKLLQFKTNKNKTCSAAQRYQLSLRHNLYMRPAKQFFFSLAKCWFIISFETSFWTPFTHYNTCV